MIMYKIFGEALVLLDLGNLNIILADLYSLIQLVQDTLIFFGG